MLTVGSKPVISFLNRANPFSRVCLFCISVRNKIYVMECEVFGPVSMARYSKDQKAKIEVIIRVSNLYFSKMLELDTYP